MRSLYQPLCTTKRIINGDLLFHATNSQSPSTPLDRRSAPKRTWLYKLFCSVTALNFECISVFALYRGMAIYSENIPFTTKAATNDTCQRVGYLQIKTAKTVTHFAVLRISHCKQSMDKGGHKKRACPRHALLLFFVLIKI